MTHISELIGQARSRAGRYRGCSKEQALTYACEDIAHENHPTGELGRTQAHDLVTDICVHENVDIPYVKFGGKRSRCTASYEAYSRTITFHGISPTKADAVHETAHCIAGGMNHDMEFRVTLVRIARRFAGVQYASLLQYLFEGVGLDMEPWSTR